ncbi:MAG: type VII toxin-antitoxin system HepT family RNase toxin [Acidimicrobiia bacterium]
MAVPDSYAEVFTILGDSGFLTERDAAALADAARFRNLLVHQYTKVDDRRVVDYLTTRLDDLKSFRMGVAKAITDQK